MWIQYQMNTSSNSAVPQLNLSAVKSNSLIKIMLNWLQAIGQWLDRIEVKNRTIARLISKVIPDQCPFERQIILFGHKILQIPPLCKLNPLYNQFVGLRFRALCYLVDQCGERI